MPRSICEFLKDRVKDFVDQERSSAQRSGYLRSLEECVFELFSEQKRPAFFQEILAWEDGSVNKSGILRAVRVAILLTLKKVSHRWIDHLSETSRVLAATSSQIVHVADRECDIYEFLQSASDHDCQYVVRSSWNRRTHEGPSFHAASTIEKKLANVSAEGKIALVIDGKPVDFCIKKVSLLLKPPQRSSVAKSMELLPLRVGVVDIQQVECTADPIHWRLLTNLPIDSIDEVVEVIAIYKQRWSIECFHRILKSVFAVEKARLANRKRLERLASLLSVVSWHIFWLFQFGRKMPSMEASKVFTPLAIEVLKASAKKLKIKTPPQLSIGNAIRIVARLGGFLGRKGDGEPGMISIWRGWRNLHERIEFMEALTYG